MEYDYFSLIRVLEVPQTIKLESLLACGFYSKKFPRKWSENELQELNIHLKEWNLTSADERRVKDFVYYMSHSEYSGKRTKESIELGLSQLQKLPAKQKSKDSDSDSEEMEVDEDTGNKPITTASITAEEEALIQKIKQARKEHGDRSTNFTFDLFVELLAQYEAQYKITRSKLKVLFSTIQ